MSFQNLKEVINDPELVADAMHHANLISPNPTLELVLTALISQLNVRLKAVEHMTMRGMGKDQFPHPDCIGHFCKWGLHHADDDEAKACNQLNPNQSCHL